MCGISGFSGDFDKELLEGMKAIQSHRGPDNADMWQDAAEGIGLAHNRLSIIDLSPDANQPMIDSNGPGVIVFNGEIYNYRELRKNLENEGVQFKSLSDTEVLLKLYQRDGVDMLSKLNGIFAFALWDREKHLLFIARDGMGVKPLYYTVMSKGFIFASELKALLLWSGVSREIDEESILHYLIYLWSPAPHTPLKAVQKLEPGQAMLVREGQIELKWYFYDIPYSESFSIDDIDETCKRLRQNLFQAVERQMVSDVPVGAFLSGGLDSSSIVAMAGAVCKGNRLQCFTIDCDYGEDGFAEDLPYAGKVAEHLGVDLHTVRVGPEIIDDLDRMIFHLDEPQADPAPLNVLLISKMAREHGIKVLLSGTGGDDLFTGYFRHYALVQERLWGWMPQVMRSGICLITSNLSHKSVMGRRFSRAFRFAHNEPDDRLIGYFTWIDPNVALGLFSRDIREFLADYDPAYPLKKSLDRLPDGVSRLNRMLYLESKHFLADHNLNYTDKMSMAVGVEVRVPLLDPDLVRFAVSLPDYWKQRGRVGKWIFKKAMEPYLPADVIYRPKTGFGAPLRSWLRNQLKGQVEELLSERVIKNRGLFDPACVRRLVEMDQQGDIDAGYTIFALICIEKWCRLFIDGKWTGLSS